MPKLPAVASGIGMQDTALKLKNQILKAGEELITQYIQAALGKAELQSSSEHARKELWDVIKTLILQSSSKLNINISKAEDILEAVSKGRCTVKEGEELLNLYKKMAEITATKEGRSLAGSGGNVLEVTILGNPQAVKTIEKPVKEVIEHEK